MICSSTTFLAYILLVIVYMVQKKEAIFMHTDLLFIALHPHECGISQNFLSALTPFTKLSMTCKTFLMLMKELAQQFGPNEGKTLFSVILHRFSSSLSFTTCGKREDKTRLSSNAERETFVAAITVLFA